MDTETKIAARDADYAPGGVAEKNASVEIDMKNETGSESGDEDVTDLFSSFPPLKGIEPEPNPLTVRAVLTGIVLGSLVNASNVYLGKSHLSASIPQIDLRGFRISVANLSKQVSRRASPFPLPCSAPSSVTDSSSC